MYYYIKDYIKGVHIALVPQPNQTMNQLIGQFSVTQIAAYLKNDITQQCIYMLLQ